MVNLIRCKTKQDSVRKNLVRPVPAGYPGRSLEAVGNDSSREMVIAPMATLEYRTRLITTHFEGSR